MRVDLFVGLGRCWQRSEEAIRSTGGEVTYGNESPGMGAENWPLVLGKSRKHSISSAWWTHLFHDPAFASASVSSLLVLQVWPLLGLKPRTKVNWGAYQNGPGQQVPPASTSPYLLQAGILILYPELSSPGVGTSFCCGSSLDNPDILVTSSSFHRLPSWLQHLGWANRPASSFLARVLELELSVYHPLPTAITTAAIIGNSAVWQKAVFKKNQMCSKEKKKADCWLGFQQHQALI